MDELRETSFPFSIADTTDGPYLSYARAQIILRFTDYTETPRQVVFNDVVSFSLSLIEAYEHKLWDDRTYIVNDSSLIKKLAATGDIDSPKDYVHKIICFNETGEYVEIVYQPMDINIL